MNIEDQPEWVEARVEARRNIWVREQIAARKARIDELRQYQPGRPIAALPSVEEDEAKIARLSQARRTRQSPEVSDVASLVWRILTGAGDAPGLASLSENMSEIEKVRYFEMLRKTDRAAAERFAREVGIMYVRATVVTRTGAAIWKNVPMTRLMFLSMRPDARVRFADEYAGLLARESGLVTEDEGVTVEFKYPRGPIGPPTLTVSVWYNAMGQLRNDPVDPDESSTETEDDVVDDD